jgi:Spy/CpxP family protein refolding chaperone
MFGILIGTGLVIAGTVALVHRHRGGHRTMFGCAMRRLKVTAEQRQRLNSLFDDAHARFSTTKNRARSLRHDLADIVAAPAVDVPRLEALESQLFEAMGEGTQVLRDILVRAHDILNPTQRQQLAEWMRRANHHHHHHHCHSSTCHC